MKFSLAFLSALISSSAAFSPAASGIRLPASSNSALGLLPKNFELAADCAMNVGQYSLEEIELLANGKLWHIIVSCELFDISDLF